MSKTPALLKDSSVNHPIAVSPNATHFMLRKGGKKAPECVWVDPNGVTVQWHPIHDFDKDTITARWGFSPAKVQDYFVMFAKETAPGSRDILGTFKRFGIEGETIVTDETGTEIVPGYPERPSASFGDMLAGLAGMKSLVDAEANSRVAEARLSHEATLASTRESNANVLNIMSLFMTKTAEMARPTAPAVDPALLALMTKMDQRLSAIEAEFEDEEEEPEGPAEVDYKKYARLVKDVRAEGMGALLTFAKDEGAMALVDALPTLKARLPEIMLMLKPMIEKAFASLTGQVQQAPQPSPSARYQSFVAPPHNGQTIPSPSIVTLPPNAASDESDGGVEVS